MPRDGSSTHHPLAPSSTLSFLYLASLADLASYCYFISNSTSAVLFLHTDRHEHMCNTQLISTMIIQALRLLKNQHHSMYPYILPLASLPFKDHHFSNYTEYNKPIKYILKKNNKVGEMLQSAFSLTCDSHSSFLVTKNMKYPRLKLRCCRITTHIGLDILWNKM